MKIYQYDCYEDYVAAQVEANVKKIKNIWVDRKTIEDIKERQPVAYTILCHGTRNAMEQKYFRKLYPDAEIVGTEISHTATDFPMTVQWDFHDVKPNWVGKFDIVYSNAIDHSYDPVKVLTTWRDQLRDDGYLYIEHGYSDIDNRCRPSDPLEIRGEEIEYLIDTVGLMLVDTFTTTGIKGRCPSRVYITRKNNANP